MTDQQVATAAPSRQLGVASFAVAIVAIGFGLSIGGAIQNPRAWGYWVAGAIISLGVALRLLI